jgi:hypothetical protein
MWWLRARFIISLRQPPVLVTQNDWVLLRFNGQQVVTQVSEIACVSFADPGMRNCMYCVGAAAIAGEHVPTDPFTYPRRNCGAKR